MAGNFCPQCGSKLEPGQAKCSFCGKDVTNLTVGTAGAQYSNQYGSQSNTQDSAQYGSQSSGQDSVQYGNQSNTQNTAQYGDQSYNQSNAQYGNQSNTQSTAQYGNQSNNQYTNQYSSQSNIQYSSQNSNYQDNTASYSYQQTMPTIPDTSNSANGLQIAGLVLGIISIVACCCSGGGIIFGIAGLVCSIMGNKDNKHGIGIAGMVCSIIGIVFGIGYLILFIIGAIGETILDGYGYY